MVFHYRAKKADFSERINIALLMKLTPDGVYQWMKENHSEQEESVYSDMWSGPENRSILEYCLYRRKEPLIDFAIAQYGYTSAILRKIFDRGDAGTRLAVLANPKGSVYATDDLFFTSASDEELKAFFSNPNITGGLFSNLFERKHSFKDLTDSRLLKIVVACRNHPRLKREYNSVFLDGYHEWEYHHTFEAAWNLAKIAPVTKEWAVVLDDLLTGCILPSAFEDPTATIKRWEVLEDFKEGDSWYLRGPFFQIRSTLARLLKEDVLFNSDDAALRIGFYRIFDPKVFTNINEFFERDGEEFFRAALYNKNMWTTEHLRNSLSSISWNCPDPNSYMDAPNAFRGAEQHFRKLHPEWFTEPSDLGDREPEPDPTGEALASLNVQVRNVEQSLSQYASKVPSSAGWWVVSALLLYLILR